MLTDASWWTCVLIRWSRLFKVLLLLLLIEVFRHFTIIPSKKNVSISELKVGENWLTFYCLFFIWTSGSKVLVSSSFIFIHFCLYIKKKFDWPKKFKVPELMTVTGWRGFFAVELNASRINSSINLWLSCHPHLYFAMKCCCWCIVKDTLLNFTYFGYYDRIFDVVMKLSKCFFIKLDFCHPVIVCSLVTCICFEYSMRKLLEYFRNSLRCFRNY